MSCIIVIVSWHFVAKQGAATPKSPEVMEHWPRAGEYDAQKQRILEDWSDPAASAKSWLNPTFIGTICINCNFHEH